ncbi:uncharacterized protein C8Q71DRAFT_823420 [Rhodofomes roseus]|uniref:Uncharacterized protein n=1 Tax=Rhodofomes roseus TaxID=34475 RepID=A0ABQ8K9E7_9APHY|nr:uncharacterized protein C8Q71DRAFT_823420 [Rhodofomes roseus]KAH9833988.1 hypothetical protein C8Q71DRAFT_823420 [Rhodofomes roseus]
MNHGLPSDVMDEGRENTVHGVLYWATGLNASCLYQYLKFIQHRIRTCSVFSRSED